MKLGVILFAFLAALAVGPLQATMTRSSFLSMLRERKSGAITPEARQQQEQALYRHLKSLSPPQLVALQKKLPPNLLRRIVDRLRVLKRQEQGGKPKDTKTSEGPNMVMSRASSVRRSGSSSSANSATGKAGSSPAGGTRAAMMARMAAAMKRMMAARRRRPKTPMDAIRGYRSFTKTAGEALSQGCTYPIATESVAETFLMGSGGCRRSATICYMKGQSCVDVGMSMMCCPPGYSSGTLRMMNQMKQMQTFINNFM